MTDKKRCEPPEEMRGSDGEHFVCGPNGLLFVALWHAAPHAGIEPLWHNAARTSTGTPAWAANEWGWRYVAPVAPPATVASLVEALEKTERQLVTWYRLNSPAGNVGTENAFADADPIVKEARIALALYRGEAGR